MTTQELTDLIDQGESQTLEFKVKPDPEIGKSFVAFANSNDGIVIVGVSDDKKIRGCSAKDELSIANTAHNCKPSIYPEIEEVKIEGKPIFVIKVKKSGSGIDYAYKNMVYRRVGTHDEPMSPKEVVDFARSAGVVQFDSKICDEATLSDIDPEKVKRFLKKAKYERRLTIDAEIPVEEALERLNLNKKGELTNAAVLLFGKTPQKFFLQARIRCARFKGNTAIDFLDMKTIDGTLIDQIDAAEKFVLSHIKRAARVVMFKREEVWEYPPNALREAIVNAVCHRDYESGGNVRIAIFDERLEITDPGALPEPLTPALLKQNHESIPRNRLIADTFFLIKNIEQWGKGTNKIVQWCVDHGLREPDFEEIGGGFMVKFYAPDDLLSLVSDKNMVDLKRLGLNERQIKALTMMINEGKVFTNKAYREYFEVSNQTCIRDMRLLDKLDLIIVEGKGKSRTYRTP